MLVDQLHPTEVAICVTIACKSFSKDCKLIARYRLAIKIFEFLHLPVPTFVERGYVNLVKDRTVKLDLITHLLGATQKSANGQTLTLDDFFQEDSPILALKKSWFSKVVITQK